jgi:hypothetical protein
MFFGMFGSGGCCQRAPMPEWLGVLFALFLFVVFGAFVYLIVITIF